MNFKKKIKGFFPSSKVDNTKSTTKSKEIDKVVVYDKDTNKYIHEDGSTTMGVPQEGTKLFKIDTNGLTPLFGEVIKLPLIQTFKEYTEYKRNNPNSTKLGFTEYLTKILNITSISQVDGFIYGTRW